MCKEYGMKCSRDFVVAYNELFKTLTPEQAKEFWPAFSDCVLGRLRHLIRDKGFLGMLEYWADTLMAEHADCKISVDLEEHTLQIWMRECPSLLILGEDSDSEDHCYCDHCDILYRPLLKDLGYKFEAKLCQHGDKGCTITIWEPK
jgi:hypothetical protein